MVLNKLLDIFLSKPRDFENDLVESNSPDITQGLDYLNDKRKITTIVDKNLHLIENFANKSKELWTEGTSK